MFWGLIMEPKRRYKQVVEKGFHISMAALDILSSGNDPTQVLLTHHGLNYLLCTLQKGKNVQVKLDLNFEEGDEVSFATNGNAHIHLTGYLLDEFEKEESDETEDEKMEEEGSSKIKRKEAQQLSSQLSKKFKTEELLKNVSEDTDSDDMNFSDILKDENSNDEDEEEESEDEDEDVATDSEEEEDSEGEESEEEDEDVESSLSKSEEKHLKTKDEKKLNGFSPPIKAKAVEEKKKGDQKKQEKKSKDKKMKNKDEKEGKAGQQQKDQKAQAKKVLQGGVQIHDLVVGNGAIAKPGKMVQVYYEGRLKHNNKLFDSTKQGNGFKFKLGGNEVIKGWDVGVQGMKVGGKRKITCPPNMAYGQKGSPPVIPANAILVFEVELKNVN